MDSVPTEGLAEAMAGIFLAYLGYSMEAGWLESSGIRRQQGENKVEEAARWKIV